MKKHLLTLLLTVSLGMYGQNGKYDVAAYVWPAYHDEPRFQNEMNIFHDGKGEWEAVYKAKPKYEGHRQPRVPLWGYLDEASPNDTGEDNKDGTEIWREHVHIRLVLV